MVLIALKIVCTNTNYRLLNADAVVQSFVFVGILINPYNIFKCTVVDSNSKIALVSNVNVEGGCRCVVTLFVPLR